MTAQGNLRILTEGRFGDAVAERLVALVPDASVCGLRTAIRDLDDLVAGAGFVALALWRRYPAETAAIDAACARYRVPWSSVTLDGRSLIMGPLVTPGRGPCHACYRRRRATHLPLPERDEAIDAAYQGDGEAGCAGFPPGSAGVAAGGIALDRADAAIAPGRIRIMDLLHCTLEETRVVRLHGCERCGERLPPGTRYLHHLLPALRAMTP